MPWAELVEVVEPSGQGLVQFAELALALLLCSLIGLEREVKQMCATSST
ncbi:hypothetical protein Misp01_30950 [Microtetraspora sp. NBRC 13810]|nr:hypothetical protein [Microtetraspora sp. NBRC 13810]GLW07965.1 hypothetical protein Misp01_30950 [Microtetraspora sp. NBRC 13810]